MIPTSMVMVDSTLMIIAQRQTMQTKRTKIMMTLEISVTLTSMAMVDSTRMTNVLKIATKIRLI